MNILVILGTAHTLHEPGRQSLVGRLIEAIYGREIASLLLKKLKDGGYHAIIDYEPLSLPDCLVSANVKSMRSRELSMRVGLVNNVCRAEGQRNVIYVSLHVNASGSGMSWMKASGWQSMVAPDASARSLVLAGYLTKAAEEHGLKVRKPAVDDPYWRQSLFVLNRTFWPAVMTENLFQDNIDDADFLLSDAGGEVIVDLHYKGISNYIDAICKK